MEKKYIVTSALPYVNGIKHLGNLAGSLLPADIYSRFLRNTGKDVIFISATDDHGTPTELAAQEAGISASEYSDIQHKKQKKIYDQFALSFDHFGRTSSKQNIELTQHFARAIHDNGYTEIKTMRQIYSIDDERFLPDRYVTGTCPHCSYESARGDQCENCATLLDPEELINPRSTISGSTNLEFRDTNHLFIKLSNLTEEVGDWVSKHENWPRLVKSIANKWLNEGLRDRCITRDLHWGVPVNIEGLEDKVFYVWFDAPIGYLAATKEWSDLDPENRDWKKYWYDSDEDIQYVQFMAKDNIPFHTVSFPATIIASGEPWKQVDYLKGFNWLNYYGDKFSTSQKRGIFTGEALEILPADYWRYYLTARSPENSDSSFTWEDFQVVVNGDLNNSLGNLVNRVIKFTESRFAGKIPERGTSTELETKHLLLLEEQIADYTQNLENLNFRKATEALKKIWTLGNQYLAEAVPWVEIKNDKRRAGDIINFSLNYIAAIGKLSEPIMPHTSKKIFEALGLEVKLEWYSDMDNFFRVRAGQLIEFPEPLFAKIEDSQIIDLKKRYGGPALVSQTNSGPENNIQP